MEKRRKITRGTGVVTVLDILAGASPAILTQEETNFRGGKRLFTQKAPVPDAALFQRLFASVRKGDRIEVTVTTEWHKDQSVTYLSAFQPVASEVLAEEAVIAN